jgi:hypothetical protein
MAASTAAAADGDVAAVGAAPDPVGTLGLGGASQASTDTVIAPATSARRTRIARTLYRHTI